VGDVRESLKLRAVVVAEEGVEGEALEQRSWLGEVLVLWLEVVRLLLLAVHLFLC
jgi:hypothetical protein